MAGVPFQFFPIYLFSHLPFFPGQHGDQVTDNKAADQGNADENDLRHGDGPEKQVQVDNLGILDHDDEKQDDKHNNSDYFGFHVLSPFRAGSLGPLGPVFPVVLPNSPIVLFIPAI